MEVGDKFERLVVVELIPEIRVGSKRIRAAARVLCCCGQEKTVRRQHLIRGDVRSCGCLAKEATRERWRRGMKHPNLKHGHAKGGISRTYRTWVCMKTRCLDPDDIGYHRYGGRGIRICERWLNSFANFLADMGERPIGMTLDRKENNGNYEPGNCCWATRSQQAKNRRSHGSFKSAVAN